MGEPTRPATPGATPLRGGAAKGSSGETTPGRAWVAKCVVDAHADLRLRRVMTLASFGVSVGCVAPVTLLIASCSAAGGDGGDGGDASTCDFVYQDRACPQQNTVPCTEVGDGTCYKKCKTDLECRDPKRPFCSVLGLWSGDFECNSKVVVCSAKKSDLCQ